LSSLRELEEFLKDAHRLSAKRVVVEVEGLGDKGTVLERLRDFLSSNISRTVVVYVR